MSAADVVIKVAREVNIVALARALAGEGLKLVWDTKKHELRMETCAVHAVQHTNHAALAAAKEKS